VVFSIFARAGSRRAASAAGLAGEGYLAAIIESSQDAIISKSLTGVVITWNNAAEKIFGYAAGEIVGRHISMLFPPDRLSEEALILARISRGERVDAFETVRRRKDGSDFPVSVTISPIRDGAGAIIGASKIVRDITERRDVEAALRKTGERLHQVIEASPSALVMTTATGSIELVNQQTERMFGYSRPELLGQRVEMLVPERFRAGHPELRRIFRTAPHSRAMGAGRDLYGLRKDGSEFPIEVGLNPLEIDGNVLVLSAIVDLTERERAEAKLRHSEERFRSIFNGVSEGIVLVDPQTTAVIEANTAGAGIYGFRPEEMVGRKIDGLAASDATDQPPAAVQIAKTVAARQPIIFDWRGKRKDGRPFWAEVSIQHMTISGDEVILATTRDVTEKRSLDEQLRQAQKMEAVGQLTGGIAHDFNNLLAIIQGNLEFLQEKTRGDADCEEMAGDALQAAKRGGVLTHQLLAFSRKQPLAPELVDLGVLIGDGVKLLRRTLGETIEIKEVVPSSLWKTKVDPNQLQNALLNLAVNARDAMPRGGKLIVEAANKVLDEGYAEVNIDAVPGPYVQITVADTGTGMSRELIDRVIEPFFTTKPVGKGSGLGLSMVYGFLKQSGGHLKIYSEPGQGTIVNLYLPKASEEDVSTEPFEDRMDHTPLEGDETILVVEDDDLVRKLAVRVLSGLGYHVLEAGDGIAALALLPEISHIDLLLTDVVLPRGLSGPDVAKMFLEARPATKVLYMSGYTRDVAINNGSLGDDAALLFKPFPKGELARKVRETLAREMPS
jgi:PAS domain S-box-containing protein